MVGLEKSAKMKLSTFHKKKKQTNKLQFIIEIIYTPLKVLFSVRGWEFPISEFVREYKFSAG